MKKLILLCLILSTACSSNDSSINVSIVGTWKPIAEVDVCSTGSIETSEYSLCEQTTRWVFSENGTFNNDEYGDNNNTCQIVYNESGTWSKSDNGLTLVTTFNGTNTFTFFEVTSTTLKIGFYDNDPNDPCDGGNLPSHYYYDLVRL